MNTDILEGKWKQMRGQVKEWWGKLTDQDLDVIDGKRDKLIGVLQEKYGWAKHDAENEVSRRLREIRRTDAASGGWPFAAAGEAPSSASKLHSEEGGT